MEIRYPEQFSLSEMADLIGHNQHSFRDHKDEFQNEQFGKSLDITNKDEFAELLESTMKDSGTMVNNNNEGRTQFYNQEDNLFISFRPDTKEHGTAFRPEIGEQYWVKEHQKAELYNYIQGEKNRSIDTIQDIRDLSSEKAIEDALENQHNSLLTSPENSQVESQEDISNQTIDNGPELSESINDTQDITDSEMDDVFSNEIDASSELESEIDDAELNATFDSENEYEPNINEDISDADLSDAFDVDSTGSDLDNDHDVSDDADMDAGDANDGPDVGDND